MVIANSNISMFNILNLISFFLITQSAISQNLKLNLEVGETYQYSSEANGQMSSEFDGDVINSNVRISGKMSFKVLNENLESLELDTKFLSIFMETKMPEETIKFDSNAEDNPHLLSQILHQFIGKSFRIELYRNGFAKEVHSEDMINGFLDSVTMIPKFQRVQMVERLKEKFGNNALKGSIEMITAIFPNKSVKLNDKWANQIKLDGEMKVVLNNTFTLKKYNKRHALIEVESVTVNEGENASMDYNETPINNYLTGNMKSIIKIDSKTGWIISSIIEQKFYGNIPITDPENEELTKNMRIRFTNKILVKGE
jgi:hypothetical protein